MKKCNDLTIKNMRKEAMTSPLKGGKRERATRVGGRAAGPGFSTNQIAQVRFYVWGTFLQIYTNPFHLLVLITL